MKTLKINNTLDWGDFMDNIHYFYDDLIGLFSDEEKVNVEASEEDFVLTKEQFIGAVGKDELIELLFKKTKELLK